MATITIPKSDVELQVKLLRLHLTYFPGMKNSKFISEVFNRGIAAIEAEIASLKPDYSEPTEEVAQPKAKKRTV